MKERYLEPQEINKDEFLRIIAEDKIVEMCQAIVDGVNCISDYNWLLDQFKLLLTHPNKDVRGVTISSVGHLARLSDEANKDQLLSLIKPLLNDTDVRGRVEDAISDIQIFLED